MENKNIDETLQKVEKKMDKVMGSEMMQTKVGKLSIGQYLTFNKKALIITLAIIIILGVLTVIPGVGWFFWYPYSIAYWVGSVYITFMLGYRLFKAGHKDLKESAIGGAVIGIVYGLIHAIFTLLSTLMTVFVFTAGLGVSFVMGRTIVTIVWIIIGSLVGGAIVSLIGFAVAGGFSQKTTPSASSSETDKKTDKHETDKHETDKKPEA